MEILVIDCYLFFLCNFIMHVVWGVFGIICLHHQVNAQLILIIICINKREKERDLAHWKFIYCVQINLWKFHIFNQNVDTCSTKIFEDYRFQLLKLERSDFSLKNLYAQKYNVKCRTVVFKNSYDITNLFLSTSTMKRL